MTREELQIELERLYSGNRRLQTLTAERSSALYRRYQHHPLPVIRAAIDALLCESGMPSTARFDAAVDEAEQAAAARSKRSAEADAQRFFKGNLPQPGIFDANEALWAEMHRQLIIALDEGRIPGEHVAAWNAAIAQHWSDGRGDDLLAEIMRIGRSAA